MNKVNLMDVLEFLLSINQTGLDITWQVNLTNISIDNLGLSQEFDTRHRKQDEGKDPPSP
ncbi:Uncharacterised protein [Streptococcus pneumoniae]|nr:Uncharacterised protein [Streptococcus pneumoniae]